jgi:acetoin utilization protein AcuC
LTVRTALIYSNKFDKFSYGADHPFKVQRYMLAYQLIKDYGLINLPEADVYDVGDVSDEQLLSFHSKEYLARLEEFSLSSQPRADFRYGLGDNENPVFPGVYDWARLGVAGSMEATRLVMDEGYDIAFNLVGGWHHAHRAKASGFSYLNDAAVAINSILKRGKRVVYLDLDAHHGDGVQEAFYDTDEVLTISLHQSGVYFFPGTGFENEIGIGKGKGYSVNIPLLQHADDALFMKAFDEIAYPLLSAYNPDVIVTQLGADSFRTDPLTLLEITTHAYSYVMMKLKALKIPWIAVGGGGYDMINVARAWTIAWSIMNEKNISPKLPAEFVSLISGLGYKNQMLLDAMHWSDEADRNLALDALENSISKIRKSVFPIIFGILHS